MSLLSVAPLVLAAEGAVRVPGPRIGLVVFATVLLPLAGAAVAVMLHGRLRAQQAVSLTVSALTAAAAVVLLLHVAEHGTVVLQAGGWPAPYGISFVVDRFSAIMVAVATVMVFLVLLYSIGLIPERTERLYFHPVYLVLGAGVSASFIAGDLFNLFVAFEILLIASYVLLTLGATRQQIRAGMTYVVINLIASTFFVVGVAYLYAATGTVSMADLAVQVQDLPEGLRNGIGVLFLVTFGIKAGLFPLFFWLPDSYPTAPSPITAVFAGLLTKVGVYAIIRTQTLLFAPQEGGSTLLLFVAGATMVVGVLGAVAQNDIKRILSFHIVSQIGYMILGLGLFTVAGLAGAILYITHHIITKTALFCVGGAIEHRWGTADLDRLGGIGRQAPVLAVLFGAAALSLAGLPPFSGFVAKLALLQAALEGGHHLVVTASLVVSALTLFSMTKIWAAAFWGAPPAAEPAATHAPAGHAGGAAGGVAVATRPQVADPALARTSTTALRSIPRTMVLATSLLIALGIGVALAAEPIHAYSLQAAEDLLTPAVYVDAVRGASEVAR